MKMVKETWQRSTTQLHDGSQANRHSETITQACSTLLPSKVTSQKKAHFSPLKHSSPPTEVASFIIWAILPVVEAADSSAGDKGALLSSSSRGPRNFLPPANRSPQFLLQSALTNLLPILYSVAKLASSQKQNQAPFCLHFPFDILTHVHSR